ncbi:MAG: virulence RhuM family protein, partial [Bryobacterales bacterium]|nr:virulence RhuM family protein [Bryobacterales bacterium]
VRLDGQTVWLTQAAMAELFQTTPQNITMHVATIYEEGELSEKATCKEYLQVRAEGNRQVQRLMKHYSLDVVLAVGYRVRSPRGTQFRQWATVQLRDLLVKGFVLDDQRIKAGRTLGEDYFDELLERIRDIRASERLFYQKITDIYATSIDYEAKAEITQTFFKSVQNKLHWACHGRTAAEMIRERADAGKPHMGLTTWKNSPKGPIRRQDVEVAKNYLSQEEITELNRVVTMYLDYAEDQARR